MLQELGMFMHPSVVINTGSLTVKPKAPMSAYLKSKEVASANKSLGSTPNGKKVLKAGNCINPSQSPWSFRLPCVPFHERMFMPR